MRCWRALLTLFLLLGATRRPASSAESTAPASPGETNHLALPDGEGPHLVVATGHQGRIQAIVTTPDGRTIVTLADDRIVRVIRADGLREVARFFRSGHVPNAAAVSVDGTRAAVAYNDAVIVYDVRSRAELGRVDGPSDTCLSFDGNDLLLWRDGLLRWKVGSPPVLLRSSSASCWRMGTVGTSTIAVYDGREILFGRVSPVGWDLKVGPSVPSTSVAFANGVAAWTESQGVRLWRLGDATTKALLPSERYGTVAFLDGGASLIHEGKATTRIDVATGRISPFDDHDAIAPLGTGLAAFATDEVLCTASSSTGKAIRCMDSIGGVVRSIALTKDGHLLVGADNAPLRLWSLSPAPDLRRYSYSTYATVNGAAAPSPDGMLIAQVGREGLVVYPLAGDQRRELHHKDFVRYDGVVWSPDGRYVTTTYDRSLVRFAADGTGSEVIPDVLPVRSVKWEQRNGIPDTYALQRRIHGLAYRTDGQVLAIGLDDRVLLLRNDRVLATLQGPTKIEPVTALAFHRKTHELAVAFADGHVRSWNTDAPGVPIRDRDLGSAVSAIAFDNSGALLAASEDGCIRLFGPRDVRPSQTIVTHRPTALALAFLPNGRVASGHFDGVVRIFSIPSGELKVELYPLGSDVSGRSEWLVARADGQFEASLRGDGFTFYGVARGQPIPFGDFASSRRRTGLMEGALSDRPERPRIAPGPAPVVQSWTPDSFDSLSFTPDGHELLGGSKSGIYAFDVGSGLLRARLSDGAPGSKVAASDETYFRLSGSLEARDRFTGGVVAIQRNDLQTILGRTPAGELVTRNYTGVVFYSESPFEPTRSIAAQDLAADSTAALSADGAVVAVAKSNGAARLWATSDLHERPPVRCAPDGVTSIAVSSGGRWIACATPRGSVVLTSTSGAASLVLRPNAFGGLQTIYAMAFHPSRPLLAVASLSGVYLYDLSRQGRELRLEGEHQRYDTVAWNPGGTIIAASALGGQIRLFDSSSGAWLRTVSPQVERVRQIGRAGRGTLVLRTSSSELYTWDGFSGHARPVDTEGHSYGFSWTPTGDTRAIANESSIVVTGPSGVSKIKRPQLAFDPELSRDARHVCFSTNEMNTTTVAALNVSDGKQVWSRAFTGGLKRLAMSRSSAAVGLLFYPDTTKGGPPTVTPLAFILGSTGATTSTYSSTWVYDLLSLDDEHWLVVDDHKIVSWNRKTGATKKTLIRAAHLALSPSGSLVVGTSEHEIHIVDPTTLIDRAWASLPNVTMQESVFLADNVVATLIEDGTVILWRLSSSSLERAGQLVITHQHGTILVSPDGHYMADAEAASVLGFTVGGHTFPFYQFDGALNDPKSALERVGLASRDTLALYAAAYARRSTGRIDGSNSAKGLKMPEASFMRPVPLTVSDAALLVSVRADGHGATIARVNLRVNGVPIFGRTGRDVSSGHKSIVDFEQEVPLQVGANRIELEAENEQGIVALGRTAIVTREGATPSSHLYIVSIGVSNYSEGNNLKYAAKDAADVADALARVAAPGSLATPPIVLRDSEVTRPRLLALRRDLERTSIEDVVIMFVAGHGLLDAHDQYVFGTHDVDFDSGAKGMRFDELVDLLAGIPARRRLLMLDTCHAGELDQDELAFLAQAEREGRRDVHFVRRRAPVRPSGAVDARTRAVAARGLFATLQRGSGVTVLAASAGAEYAYEEGTIQNGRFSHALIEGLKSGKADLDGDGAILVSELIDYLSKTVSQETHGFQVPQARELNRDLDFDLAPGRPHKQPWVFDGCFGIGQATKQYNCGALLANSSSADHREKPSAILDKLAADLAPQFGPNLKVSWRASHDFRDIQARQFVATAADYPRNVHVGWIAVNSHSQRSAVCVAVDALPEAIERCKRAIPSLTLTLPPNELR